MDKNNILFLRYSSAFGQEYNHKLLQEYLKIKDQDSLEKTHFIAGRFENVYIKREAIQGLPDLLDEALAIAASQLNRPASKLRLGFWFNEMYQGHSTSAHTHEEDDELLSGVYYIQVPEKSGDLVLGNETQNDVLRITPKAGEFIFFAPDCLHSVTENQTSEMRLSIGMNIGPKE